MTHDIDRLADQFQSKGFVLVEQFLAKAELLDLDRELHRYIEQVVPTVAANHVYYESGRSGSIKHLSVPELYDDFFKSWLTRPATIKLVAACLGQPVEPAASEVFYKPARMGSSAPYHQDNAYLHLEPADGVAVWIALDDTTVENGAVHFARGSHHAGELPHFETGVPLFSKGLTSPVDAQLYPEVPAVMRRGDASIHHILCAHRSGPNCTDQNRRGYVLNYKSVHAKVNKARADAHAAYVARL